MDTRELFAPPPSLQHDQPRHHHHPPAGMTIAPNSYPIHHLFNNDQNANFINPFSSSDHYVDGSSPSSGFGAGGFNMEPEKKKLGRPRKYNLMPDDDIAIGLVPNAVPDVAGVGGRNLEPLNDGDGGTLNVGPSTKKQRGRPAGAQKKQLDALGVPGVGFTPHVIMVKEGEDIASKMVSFSQEGARTVCILSANGAISNVTLQQSPASGGAVSYEGRFEIISLSGSFVHSESDGNSKASGLSVSLAGSDGRVLGGTVAGVLVAASPVQVIVGSFIVDGKKPKPSNESSESGGSPLDMPMYSNIGWPSNMPPN